jgi:hypothetical protein
VALLQVVPYKGSLPTSVPTDPLIYRFYELISVYGTTFKELIHEEFGDGIMSRDRLQDGPEARAEFCRRSGEHHHVGQVPALQVLLTLIPPASSNPGGRAPIQESMQCRRFS